MPPDHHRVPGTWHRQSAQDVHQEVTGCYGGQFPFQLRDDQLLPPLQQSSRRERGLDDRIIQSRYISVTLAEVFFSKEFSTSGNRFEGVRRG